MSGVQLRDARGPAEYPRLVEIWRSAVDATHDFLAEVDRSQIEEQLPGGCFPQVRLTVAELNSRAVGFAGTTEDKLEMLFVDASCRGHGVGSSLLEYVIGRHGVRSLDVNEQNRDAALFYVRRGFRVRGRSERDDAGRPYPILHLALGSEIMADGNVAEFRFDV